jgi:hypothetical protein
VLGHQRAVLPSYGQDIQDDFYEILMPQGLFLTPF